MLTLAALLPLAVAGVLALARGLPAAVARWIWLGAALAELGVLVAATALALPLPSSGLALEERSPTLAGLGTSYHVGVDGLSLPLLLLTGVLSVACALWGLRESDRPRQQAALLLLIEGTCVGLFSAQDLLLFFLWFDLSIVGMYFVIAGWGHGEARRSALTFFLYTFLGSIVLLLGFIGLSVGADASAPRTFDLVQLATRGSSGGGTVTAALVLAAILVGLAIKTPTVPFHTWLPSAHTDAPTVGSVVLAGLLLKMGTYGFLRVALPLLPEAWRALAWPITIVGLVSVLYGALVALAQTDAKRMIAYTSITHMGFVVLAVGAAGLGGADAGAAQRLAISGAVVQMVSHGLTTAALFLLAGVLRERSGTSELAAFGGLGRIAPRFATAFAVASFASLGLPGFSGFVAELSVLAGSIGVTWVAALALPGIVLTAALLLVAYQRLATGPAGEASEGFADLRPSELLAVAPLLVLSLAIGVLPGPLLALIEPAAAALVQRLG